MILGEAARPGAGKGKVSPSEVTIERAKGAPGRGGGPGGEAWLVKVDGLRAGVVFINVIDEAPVGRHASIQIYLNLPSQGRGVGAAAYRLACQASLHDPVYAHMRKSNPASRIAAERAGFTDVSPPGYRQLILERRRSGAKPKKIEEAATMTEDWDVDIAVLTEAPKPPGAPRLDGEDEVPPAPGQRGGRRPAKVPAPPGDPGAADDPAGEGGAAETGEPPAPGDEAADADDEEEAAAAAGEGDGQEGPGDAGLAPEVDPLADVQKRVATEKLYDDIEEVEAQCRELQAAAASVAEKAGSDEGRAASREVMRLMKEAERQCGIVRANLAGLGPDNSRLVYDSVRERVEAAAASLKHVIDGDEDFRTSGPGEPQQVKPEEARQ